MKQIKSLTLPVVLGAVLVSALPALAGPGDGGFHGGPCMKRHGPAHFERMDGALELTEDQKTQLESWREQNRADTAGRRDAVHGIHRQMHELVTADTVDEAAIRAKAGELGEARADRAVEHAYFMQQVRSILTPEQYEKFKTLKGEGARRGRMGKY